MRFEIHYNHMERSDALDTFVTEKVEAICQVLHRQDCHVQVWLVTENSRFSKGQPAYKCEIEVRYSPKRDVFVSKTSDDMYTAVNEAALAAKNLIREDSRHDHHARNPQKEISAI